MRSMKTLLRLLGAVSLTTVTASSIVACWSSKAPDLHVAVAKLLDWYDAQGKSKINQKLNKCDTAGKEKYSIITDDSLIKPANLFKDKLLVEDFTLGNFKAKNTEAKKFLSELGFKSGSESKDYSTYDVTKISALIAKVTSSNPGKIEENGITDFKVFDGTCQVDIMNKTGNCAKVKKSYTIKTLNNDTLGIQFKVSSIVTTANLDLTKEKGYVRGGRVLTSLPWKDDKSAEKNLYNSLVKLFGKESLNWTSDSAKQNPIIIFPTSGKAYLTVRFWNIKVSANLDCGNLPTT